MTPAEESCTLAAAAVERLDTLADGGGWCDFWVAAGPSTSWVTAYAGHALAVAARCAALPDAVRARARARAAAAADALVAQGRAGAWGWSPATRADADSTAWAARALLATGRPVDDRTWAFLAGHVTERGYRTYRSARHTGTWARPTGEVSAVVLLAQHEAGRLGPGELALGWRRWCAGTTDSHWWASPWQPRALVASAAAAAGVTEVAEVPDVHAARRAAGGSGAEDAPVGDLAARWWAASIAGGAHAGGRGGARALLAARLPGGGWPGDTVVLVPAQQGGGPAVATVDARGVFTTATVLHAALAALCAAARVTPDTGRAARRPATRAASSVQPPPRMPGRDTRWDAGVAAVAESQGVDAGLALSAFRELTHESLAARSPWPSPALSVLAAGSPVEFSASARPALRFTAEVGDPRLPTAARLRCGLAAVGRTAGTLGLREGWDAADGVVAVLADPDLPVPPSTRFRLWAGVDLPPVGPPTLKAYLSLHPGEVADWPGRRAAALGAAGIPTTGAVRDVLDLMRRGGWGHEVGIGVGPHGRWALKLYDELDRWRPDLVAGILERAGLPGTVGDLAPEIPGVLRATTAGRRRSGIAVRVDPATGDVVDLTTAVAFPVPLVGRGALTTRVVDWLVSLGHPAEPLTALVAAVEPGWADAPPAQKQLSLVTRTVGRAGTSTTVYVRPPDPAPAVGHEGRPALAHSTPPVAPGRSSRLTVPLTAV